MTELCPKCNRLTLAYYAYFGVTMCSAYDCSYYVPREKALKEGKDAEDS